MANSYEHDSHGLGSETASDRVAQVNKRFRKLESLSQNLPAPYFDEVEEARATLVGFGSTKGALLAAKALLADQGIAVNVLNLNWMSPFPKKAVTEILNRVTNPICVEGNATHQLATLIKQETGIDIYHKRVKYDGRPFYPQEIVAWTKEIVDSK